MPPETITPLLRPLTPDDLVTVHALVRRIEVADAVPIITPFEEIEQLLDDPHLDLAHDTRVAEVEGRIVAWGQVWHRPGVEDEERAFVLGGVDPAFRGRGVGRALLAWLIERAGEIVRRREGASERWVRAQCYDFEAGARRLYARFGLEPARYNDELRRDLADLPPMPDLGTIRIVPWDAARSEPARLAQNAAFGDHWGSTPRDVATWEHDLTSPGTRLDLSFFALDGEEVVGVCRNAHFPDEDALEAGPTGWIMNLSVVRSHRKRGVASGLVVRSLEAFKAAGLTHTALGVDSQNPTGAYGLYEKLGYEPTHRIIVHQRAV